MNAETLRKIRRIVINQMQREQPNPEQPVEQAVAPVEPVQPQEPIEPQVSLDAARPSRISVGPLESVIGNVESGLKKTDNIRNQLIFGDCLEFLKGVESNTVTACLVDPPYGLSEHPDMRPVLEAWLRGEDYVHSGKGFMNSGWDSFVPGPEIWKEVFRVLKPGGHIFSFFGTRSFDIGTLALRLAGLEIRDKLAYFCEVEDASICWAYGSGFPKSLNISKAITAYETTGKSSMTACRRAAMGEDYEPSDTVGHTGNGSENAMNCVRSSPPEQKHISENAKQWAQYGTSLKPAHEPLAHFSKSEPDTEATPLAVPPFKYEPKVSTRERNYGCKNLFWKHDGSDYQPIEQDEYDALKADNEARKDEAGFEPVRIAEGNIWPTVKSINFMRYLVKMVKMPKDNLILDPFCGTGTTAIACILEGCDFVTIERDPVAHRIAAARIEYFQRLKEKGLK